MKIWIFVPKLRSLIEGAERLQEKLDEKLAFPEKACTSEIRLIGTPMANSLMKVCPDDIAIFFDPLEVSADLRLTCSHFSARFPKLLLFYIDSGNGERNYGNHGLKSKPIQYMAIENVDYLSDQILDKVLKDTVNHAVEAHLK